MVRIGRWDIPDKILALIGIILLILAATSFIFTAYEMSLVEVEERIKDSKEYRTIKIFGWENLKGGITTEITKMEYYKTLAQITFDYPNSDVNCFKTEGRVYKKEFYTEDEEGKTNIILFLFEKNTGKGCAITCIKLDVQKPLYCKSTRSERGTLEIIF